MLLGRAPDEYVHLVWGGAVVYGSPLELGGGE